MDQEILRRRSIASYDKNDANMNISSLRFDYMFELSILKRKERLEIELSLHRKSLPSNQSVTQQKTKPIIASSFRSFIIATVISGEATILLAVTKFAGVKISFFT